MDTCLEKIDHDGYTIEIHADPDAASPRENENLGVMALSYRDYILPNEVEGFDIMDYAPDLNAAADALIAEHGAVNLKVVSVTDHSGLWFKIGGLFDQWDSSYVGFIFTTWDRITATGTPEEEIDDVLRAELADYDNWGRGGYVGVIVTDPEGNDVDSCWGYDDYEYAVTEAKSWADLHLAEHNRTVAGARALCEVISGR